MGIRTRASLAVPATCIAFFALAALPARAQQGDQCDIASQSTATTVSNDCVACITVVENGKSVKKKVGLKCTVQGGGGNTAANCSSGTLNNPPAGKCKTRYCVGKECFDAVENQKPDGKNAPQNPTQLKDFRDSLLFDGQQVGEIATQSLTESGQIQGSFYQQTMFDATPMAKQDYGALIENLAGAQGQGSGSQSDSSLLDSSQSLYNKSQLSPSSFPDGTQPHSVKTESVQGSAFGAQTGFQGSADLSPQEVGDLVDDAGTLKGGVPREPSWVDSLKDWVGEKWDALKDAVIPDAEASNAVRRFDVTGYAPCASASACRIQGGPNAWKRGPDGTYDVKTFDDYRKWVETGGKEGSPYVTGAADPSRLGEKYVIDKVKWKSPLDGKTYTMENVPVAIHDKGEDFIGRPNKLDLAFADKASSEAQARAWASGQPFLADDLKFTRVSNEQFAAIIKPPAAPQGSVGAGFEGGSWIASTPGFTGAAELGTSPFSAQFDTASYGDATPIYVSDYPDSFMQSGESITEQVFASNYPQTPAFEQSGEAVTAQVSEAAADASAYFVAENPYAFTSEELEAHIDKTVDRAALKWLTEGPIELISYKDSLDDIVDAPPAFERSGEAITQSFRDSMGADDIVAAQVGAPGEWQSGEDITRAVVASLPAPALVGELGGAFADTSYDPLGSFDAPDDLARSDVAGGPPGAGYSDPDFDPLGDFGPQETPEAVAEAGTEPPFTETVSAEEAASMQKQYADALAAEQRAVVNAQRANAIERLNEARDSVDARTRTIADMVRNPDSLDAEKLGSLVKGAPQDLRELQSAAKEALDTGVITQKQYNDVVAAKRTLENIVGDYSVNGKYFTKDYEETVRTALQGRLEEGKTAAEVRRANGALSKIASVPSTYVPPAFVQGSDASSFVAGDERRFSFGGAQDMYGEVAGNYAPAESGFRSLYEQAAAGELVRGGALDSGITTTPQEFASFYEQSQAQLLIAGGALDSGFSGLTEQEMAEAYAQYAADKMDWSRVSFENPYQESFTHDITAQVLAAERERVNEKWASEGVDSLSPGELRTALDERAKPPELYTGADRRQPSSEYWQWARETSQLQEELDQRLGADAAIANAKMQQEGVWSLTREQAVDALQARELNKPEGGWANSHPLYPNAYEEIDQLRAHIANLDDAALAIPFDEVAFSQAPDAPEFPPPIVEAPQGSPSIADIGEPWDKLAVRAYAQQIVPGDFPASASTQSQDPTAEELIDEGALGFSARLERAVLPEAPAQQAAVPDDFDPIGATPEIDPRTSSLYAVPGFSSANTIQKAANWLKGAGERIGEIASDAWKAAQGPSVAETITSYVSPYTDYFGKFVQAPESFERSGEQVTQDVLASNFFDTEPYRQSGEEITRQAFESSFPPAQPYEQDGSAIARDVFNSNFPAPDGFAQTGEQLTDTISFYNVQEQALLVDGGSLGIGSSALTPARVADAYADYALKQIDWSDVVFSDAQYAVPDMYGESTDLGEAQEGFEQFENTEADLALNAQSDSAPLPAACFGPSVAACASALGKNWAEQRTAIARDLGVGCQAGGSLCNRQILQAIREAGGIPPPTPLPRDQFARAAQAYSGDSVVNFLKAGGLDSSFRSRSLMAEQYLNIPTGSYRGTAAQNAQFLACLRNADCRSR